MSVFNFVSDNSVAFWSQGHLPNTAFSIKYSKTVCKLYDMSNFIVLKALTFENENYSDVNIKTNYVRKVNVLYSEGPGFCAVICFVLQWYIGNTGKHAIMYFTDKMYIKIHYIYMHIH